MKIILYLCLLLMTCSGNVVAQDQDHSPKTPERKTLKVLGIGNSFTGNVSKYIKQIFEADGRYQLDFGLAVIGSCSLERHWRHVEEHQANPEKGKHYWGKSLKDMLSGKQWDVVTMQQYSWLSDKAESYQPYGNNLAAFIRKHAPQAKIMIHQTWSYRADDAPLQGKLAQDYPNAADPQKEMWKNLRAAYLQLAQDTQADAIIPVGDAFQAARSLDNWGFKIDPNFNYTAEAKHPELPDQTHSLTIGISWKTNRKGKWKRVVDTHHAGRIGEYLAGLVWFETIVGSPPQGQIFIPKELTETDAKLMQSVAHKVVAAHNNNEH